MEKWRKGNRAQDIWKHRRVSEANPKGKKIMVQKLPPGFSYETQNTSEFWPHLLNVK